MKNNILLFIFFVFCISFSHSVVAVTYYSLGDGDWAEAIWSTNPIDNPANGIYLPNAIEGGSIGNNDEIIIRHTITNNNGIGITNGGKITIDSGGHLDMTDLSIHGGATIIVKSGGVLDADLINWTGDFIFANYGTVNTPDCTPITEGTGFCTSTPLPVELLFFYAKPDQDQVLLFWSTASELNNDFFTLEKSRNGRDFVKLDEIAGNGTTNLLSDYSFIDSSPYLGLSYYRLSQTDFDGTTEVFPVESVLFEGNKRFTVSPNPIADSWFNLKISGKANNEILELNIIDLQGRLVENKQLKTDYLGNIDAEIQLDKPLKQGVYIVELVSDQRKEYLKVAAE